MPKVYILREACKGMEECGICAYVCPKEVFAPSKNMNSYGFIPPEAVGEVNCIGCENCYVFCPDFAIFVGDGDKEDTNE
jgi:2-oxoglutarate ferredoxin oxidoreductase subunit delta